MVSGAEPQPAWTVASDRSRAVSHHHPPLTRTEAGTALSLLRPVSVWVVLPCTAGAGLPYPSPPLLAANLQVLIELTFGGQQEPRRQYQWPFTLVYYPLRQSQAFFAHAMPFRRVFLLMKPDLTGRCVSSSSEFLIPFGY